MLTNSLTFQNSDGVSSKAGLLESNAIEDGYTQFEPQTVNAIRDKFPSETKSTSIISPPRQGIPCQLT